jgi:hypothetical protein
MPYPSNIRLKLETIFILRVCRIYNDSIYAPDTEELDDRAVSALGVRSRKLSTGFNGQS